MRVLFYFLAAIAGLFGLLGVLRTFEHLVAGDGFFPTQLVIGAVGILLALLWIKRARSTGS